MGKDAAIEILAVRGNTCCLQAVWPSLSELAVPLPSVCHKRRAGRSQECISQCRSLCMVHLSLQQACAACMLDAVSPEWRIWLVLCVSGFVVGLEPFL